MYLDKEPVEPTSSRYVVQELYLNAQGQCVPEQTGGGGCLIATASIWF